MSLMPDRFAAFVCVIRARFTERGWLWLISGICRRIGIELLWLPFLPLGCLGHWLGYRRLYVQTWHIGHLAAEIDTFLKEQILGFLPKRRRFVTAPSHHVANAHLLTYWRKKVTVISSLWLSFVLELMSRRWVMREDLSRYVSGYFGTQAIYRINRLWGERSPLLAMQGNDELWAREQFARLGIPPGQWFVCVHVREGSYLPKNEAIQTHRNATVTNAIPAMKEIVRRGGLCIRMGDPGMTPLPEISGVIDYARHPIKSDRLDILLCAKARFFLGNTSGLAFVCTSFGVPVAHANMIPVETLGIRPCDLSMPKLLWSEKLGRYLTFKEALNTKAGGYFFTHQYRNAGIQAEENSPKDLSDLVTEMLDRLDGRFAETPDDQLLHAAYLSLFRPGHYSYGAVSRICLGFLRRHRNLLPLPPYEETDVPVCKP